MGLNPPELSLTGQIIITILVSILVIVATLGNVAVIYLLNGGKPASKYRNGDSMSTTAVVPSAPRPRKNQLTRHSVTCIFLLNLSIADLLHILLCAPFTVVADVLLIHWPFGSFLCRFVNYVQGVVVFLCAFTHVVLSIDRLAAIQCPIWRRRKLSATGARLIVLGIWLCAMAIPIPSLIVCQLVKSEDGLFYCQEVWPGSTLTTNATEINNTSNIPNEEAIILDNITDGWEANGYASSPIETAYNLTSLLFQYVIPLIVITGTYAAIVCRVWGSPAPGEGNVQRDEKRGAAKKRLIKMVIIVATLYAVSQLPRHLAYLVTVNSPRAFERETMMYIWLVCHFCTWSATCYNPFIYAWMNRAFRRGLYDLFYLIFYWFFCYCTACFCCCCRQEDGTPVTNGKGNITSGGAGRFRLSRSSGWPQAILSRAQRQRLSTDQHVEPEVTIEFANVNTNCERLESNAVSAESSSDGTE
ncbi:Neuropeptide Y receptor [Fasciola gigantica]|uniref:Neuropeptide Y receptor n=1 Tax=Fasciola gigantica TaxID=46835 RepID=A0A504YW46_FASGI|nr:Neuropeptide Y receptor [Fasciola gigantica]